jgi:DNA-binding NarL/FixJ family response regulator
MRLGLRAILEAAPDIEIVDALRGPDSDPSEGEADVVITTSALSLIARVTQGNSMERPPTLLLTDGPIDAQQLLESSRVQGILPAESTSEEVAAAVRAVAAGLVVGVRQMLYSGPNGADQGPLTAREVQVLGLMSRGLANKQIAVELGVSEHTVKFHVSSIYSKLNAVNRTQAVREGLRHGWIVL